MTICDFYILNNEGDRSDHHLFSIDNISAFMHTILTYYSLLHHRLFLRNSCCNRRHKVIFPFFYTFILTCYRNATHITKLYQPFVKEWQLQFISISFHYYIIADIYSRKMFRPRKWQIQLSLIFFLIICQCLFLMNDNSTNVEKCTEHFMFACLHRKLIFSLLYKKNHIFPTFYEKYDLKIDVFLFLQFPTKKKIVEIKR